MKLGLVYSCSQFKLPAHLTPHPSCSAKPAELWVSLTIIKV